MSVKDLGNLQKLRAKRLPEYNTEEEIAFAMGMSAAKLRFLAFQFLDRNYYSFTIQKKTGEERIISAPRFDIKTAQKWILQNILEKLEANNAAHGFCQNRSIVTNAKPHVGADIVVKIDLQNFFESISYKRVQQLFLGFGYSEIAARIFALICTKVTTERRQIKGKNKYKTVRDRHLPQGAPTSPAISNLICDRLDRRLAKMAQNLDFIYTRYADDLTFSTSGDRSNQI